MRQLSPGEIVRHAAATIPGHQPPPPPPATGTLARPRQRARRSLRRRAAMFLAAALVPLSLWAAAHQEVIEQTARRATTDAQAMLRLRIGQVLVEGRHRTSRLELIAALGLHRGQHILEVDLDRVRARLGTLPWVATSHVERRLPDAILVRIKEREPIARWYQGRRLVLVDRAGHVFRPRDMKGFANLPLLAGVRAPEGAAALFAMLGRHPALAVRVVRARRIGERRWDLRLRGGTVVRLPGDRPGDAWDRLAGLDRDHRLLDRGLEIIDMRLADRLILKPTRAVRRRPGNNT